MNEMIIFNNLELPPQDQLVLLGAAAVVLGNAVMCRYDGDETKAQELLHEASTLFHPADSKEFDALYNAVATFIYTRDRKNEFYYQALFLERISLIHNDIFPVSRKHNGRDIPDAWCSWDGEVVPVEVKLNNFDEKALCQLMRYITAYETKKGIAVGKNATVVLPPNILFISLDDLERSDKANE